MRESTVGTVAITVEPVVAGIIGVALLGEDLIAPRIVGVTMVLAGAVLAQVRPRKARLSGGPGEATCQC